MKKTKTQIKKNRKIKQDKLNKEVLKLLLKIKEKNKAKDVCIFVITKKGLISGVNIKGLKEIIRR